MSDLAARQPEVVAGSDPAANAEFSVSVPAGEVWELLAVSVALVQGATQTPQPALTIDDGTNIVAQLPGSTAVQAVSTTCQYTWAPGLEITGQIGATTAVRSHGALPSGLVLPAGFRVRSVTTGIGANSNYGVPRLLVRKRSGAGFPN